MIGKVIIEYLDKETNKKIEKDTNIFNEKLGKHIYFAKDINGYTLVSPPNTEITVTLFKKNFIIQFYYLKDKELNKVNMDLSKKEVQPLEYVLDLDLFSIKSNGTSPTETSTGINNALQYVKSINTIERIIFPKGIYAIDENIPIIIDHSDITIDFNGSTLFSLQNSKHQGSIIKIINSANNVHLTNGIIKGTGPIHNNNNNNNNNKIQSEVSCGILFEGCSNITVTSMNVCEIGGDGIILERNKKDEISHTIFCSDIQIGSIDNLGNIINTGNINITRPFDISDFGKEFELGYSIGNQGYYYIKEKEYLSYFYNEDNYFISCIPCLQFRKVKIPMGAKYVRFVFPQASIWSKVGYVAWITNLKIPTNVLIQNCNINNNLFGLSLKAAAQCNIEDNTFYKNGVNHLNYALGINDQCEVIQDLLVKNNKFTSNINNDIKSLGGDALILEKNNFSSNVDIGEKSTNIKLLNNIFNKCEVSYKYSSNIESSNNEFINSNLKIVYIDGLYKNPTPSIQHEKIINSNIYASKKEKISKSIITNNNYEALILNGTFEECSIEAKRVYLTGDIENSKINNTIILAIDRIHLLNCIITNSTINTNTNAKIATIRNCKITDSTLLATQWGSFISLSICNNDIIIKERNEGFLTFGGRIINSLIFENNVVTNHLAYPVFNMNNTSYGFDNGTATIKNNTINQYFFDYVFTGVDVEIGMFKISEENNSLSGATLFNPIYKDNPNFIFLSKC